MHLADPELGGDLGLGEVLLEAEFQDELLPGGQSQNGSDYFSLFSPFYCFLFFYRLCNI